MELPFSKVLKIDGKPLYDPTHAPVPETNLQSSAERSTADGILHKETIRYGITGGVQISYDLMDEEKLIYTRNLVMQKKEYFQFTYSHYGVIKTIECYCNDFSAEPYSLELKLWQNITFTCIER